MPRTRDTEMEQFEKDLLQSIAEMKRGEFAPRTPHLVFVFGTLKEGYPNFATNRGRRIPGDFVTRERYPLYLMGERFSPWLVSSPAKGSESPANCSRSTMRRWRPWTYSSGSARRMAIGVSRSSSKALAMPVDRKGSFTPTSSRRRNSTWRRRGWGRWPNTRWRTPGSTDRARVRPETWEAAVDEALHRPCPMRPRGLCSYQQPGSASTVVPSLPTLD